MLFALCPMLQPSQLLSFTPYALCPMPYAPAFSTSVYCRLSSVFCPLPSALKRLLACFGPLQLTGFFFFSLPVNELLQVVNVVNDDLMIIAAESVGQEVQD